MYLEVFNWVLKMADIALLKVQSSQTLEFCAREAMQILGEQAYMRGNRVERIYREVRVNAIGGGSEEIMKDLVPVGMGYKYTRIICNQTLLPSAKCLQNSF